MGQYLDNSKRTPVLRKLEPGPVSSYRCASPNPEPLLLLETPFAPRVIQAQGVGRPDGSQEVERPDASQEGGRPDLSSREPVLRVGMTLSEAIRAWDTHLPRVTRWLEARIQGRAGESLVPWLEGVIRDQVARSEPDTDEIRAIDGLLRLLSLPANPVPGRARVSTGHWLSVTTGLAVAIGRGLGLDAEHDAGLIAASALHTLWPRGTFASADITRWQTTLVTALKTGPGSTRIDVDLLQTVLNAMASETPVSGSPHLGDETPAPCRPARPDEAPAPGRPARPDETPAPGRPATPDEAPAPCRPATPDETAGRMAGAVRVAAIIADAGAHGDFRSRMTVLEAACRTLGTVPEVALAILDADRVQQYLLESNRLPDIRGGSHLLVKLEQEGVRAVLADEGLPFECVLFSGGGRALVVLPGASTKALSDFTNRLEQVFLRGRPGEKIPLEGTWTATATAASLQTPLEDLVGGPKASGLADWLEHVRGATGAAGLLLDTFGVGSGKGDAGQDAEATTATHAEATTAGNAGATTADNLAARAAGNAGATTAGNGTACNPTGTKGAEIPDTIGLFATTLRLLNTKLHAHKEARVAHPHFPGFLLAQTCEACLIRPASRRFLWEEDAREIHVCQPCYVRHAQERRRRKGRSATTGPQDAPPHASGGSPPHAHDIRPGSSRETRLNELYHWLSTSSGPPSATEDGADTRVAEDDYREMIRQGLWDQIELPRTLEDVANAGASSKARGYLGYLYADGNGFGDLMDAARSPGEVRNLAHDIASTIGAALFRALEACLGGPASRPLEKGDQTGANDPTEPHQGCIRYHPFEILVMGGDDLLVVLPADVAFEAACRLGQAFEQATAGLTIKIGVLLTSVSTPLAQARDVVFRLMKHAGRASRARGHSAIDFQLLPADTADVSELEVLRNALYGLEGEIGSQTAGGALTTERPLSLERAEAMLECIRALEHFPMSQLTQLEQAARQGPLTRGSAFYFYKRAQAVKRAGGKEDRDPDARLYRTLSAFLEGVEDLPIEKTVALSVHPFRRLEGDEIYRTALSDLLELRPFIRSRSSRT